MSSGDSRQSSRTGAVSQERGPVLLVGASGRVGRLVVHHWPKSVPLLASQRRAAPGGAALLWSPPDGPGALLEWLAQTGATPSALVMLAGVTPAPGISEAELQGNRTLAMACLAAAQTAGIQRVLLASSSAVYGVEAKGQPFAETALPAPLSPYGRAKLAMEAVAEPYRQAGLDVVSLRIGNVAGADALLYPLTAALRTSAPRTAVRIDTFADGLGPLRSYIGPQTMARVLASLSLFPGRLPEALNLAAPRPVRMAALAAAAGWPCEMVPAPATAHQSITLDCSRLARLCPMVEKDSDPAAMVAQWKATLPA